RMLTTRTLGIAQLVGKLDLDPVACFMLQVDHHSPRRIHFSTRSNLRCETYLPSWPPECSRLPASAGTWAGIKSRARRLLLERTLSRSRSIEQRSGPICTKVAKSCKMP